MRDVTELGDVRRVDMRLWSSDAGRSLVRRRALIELRVCPVLQVGSSLPLTLRGVFKFPMLLRQNGYTDKVQYNFMSVAN